MSEPSSEELNSPVSEEDDPAAKDQEGTEDYSDDDGEEFVEVEEGKAGPTVAYTDLNFSSSDEEGDKEEKPPPAKKIRTADPTSGDVSKGGPLPPPWVNCYEHPYSMFWRMGGGEDIIVKWWNWWRKQPFTEEEKIAYFTDEKFTRPPHCWLSFVVTAIWDEDNEDDDEPLEKLSPTIAACYERLKDVGLGGYEDFQKDLNDEKWCAF